MFVTYDHNTKHYCSDYDSTFETPCCSATVVMAGCGLMDTLWSWLTYLGWYRYIRNFQGNLINDGFQSSIRYHLWVDGKSPPFQFVPRCRRWQLSLVAVVAVVLCNWPRIGQDLFLWTNSERSVSKRTPTPFRSNSSVVLLPQNQFQDARLAGYGTY